MPRQKSSAARSRNGVRASASLADEALHFLQVAAAVGAGQMNRIPGDQRPLRSAGLNKGMVVGLAESVMRSSIGTPPTSSLLAVVVGLVGYAWLLGRPVHRGDARTGASDVAASQPAR